jgi:serine/threonine protein kinase
VHRDIKPSNLLLDESGKAWVTDFGLAAMADAPQLTLTGDLLGTLRYMSPEQAAGHREDIDERTDIYSLGVTLYELVTLQPAFRQTARAAVLKQVLEGDCPPPRQVNHQIPRDLEAIVLQAMARQPESRYLTARELADDLRRFLDGQPIAARRPGRFSRGWQLARNRTATIAVVMTIGLAVLSAAWSTQYLALSTRPPDRVPGTQQPIPPAKPDPIPAPAFSPSPPLPLISTRPHSSSSRPDRLVVGRRACQ